MKHFWLWTIAILSALVALFMIAGNAIAAPGASHRGCSSMSIMGTLAADRWSAQIDIDPTSGNTCVITGSADSGVTDFGANTVAGWRILCSHTDGGATGPQAATTAEARLYWDNAAFGVPTVATGSGFIRTINLLTNCPDGASQSNQFITTVYCTDTGLVTGSPRYGNQRIMVHVASTGGVAPYDINSDTAADVQGVAAAVGFVRCVPDVTAANVSATGTGYHYYVGGDVLRASITASASDPFTAAANQVLPTANCGSANNFAAIDLSVASAVTVDQEIVGATNVWVDDCTLTVSWLHSNTSSISLYSGVPYGKWNASSIPASTTLSGDKRTLTFDPTDDVDRTLTPTGTCQVSINGASAGTLANRKDAVLVNACHPWKTARGDNVPNNRAGRGWYQFTSTYRDITDFPSFDGLFGSQGDFAYTLQSTTSADTCATTCYHKMVETFDTTARTDAVLLNWGNTTAPNFGVSDTYVAANITNNKPPTHTNATSFLIGNDQEEQFVYFLHNQALQPVQSVNVTCFRTKPTTVTESSVSFGPTNAQGNTSATTVTYSVDTPPGTWQTTCSGSMNGNSFTYTIAYFHTRSFTADISINVHWNVTRQANASYFANVTVLVAEYDPSTDGMVAIFPDLGTVPKLNVSAYDASVGRYTNTLISRQAMLNTDGPTSSSYYWNFYTSANNLCDIVALVNTNLTGNPFAGSEGYHLNNTACGALPFVASCGLTMADVCANFFAINGTFTNGTFANVSTSNITTTNLTFEEANGVIETAFDPYIPILLWGGLFLAFMWIEAPIPAVASLMALAASLPTTPIWSTPASVMLVSVSIALHVVWLRWLKNWWDRYHGREPQTTSTR